MSWGELFGSILGGVAGTTVISKWMNLTHDADELRDQVRMDIADFGQDTIERFTGGLDGIMRSASMTQDTATFKKAYIVKEILWEQAREAGIVDE